MFGRVLWVSVGRFREEIVGSISFNFSLCSSFSNLWVWRFHSLYNETGRMLMEWPRKQWLFILSAIRELQYTFIYSRFTRLPEWDTYTHTHIITIITSQVKDTSDYNSSPFTVSVLYNIRKYTLCRKFNSTYYCVHWARL